MTQILKDIRHWSRVDPSWPALDLDEGVISYELFEKLIQQARALLHLELPSRTSGIVAVHVQNIARSWIWTIAARSLGFDTVNADVRAFEPDLVAYITDVEGPPAGLGLAVHIGPEIVTTRLRETTQLDDPECMLAGRHLLLSSGTTGVPKIVPLDEGHHHQAAIDQKATLGYDRDSIVYGWIFPLHTAVGYRSPVMTWGVGGTVAFSPTPQKVFGRLAVTSAILTPGLLQDLVAIADHIPRSDGIRLIITGGPLGWSLAEQTKRTITTNLWSMYGSTEVGAACMTPIEVEEDTYLYRCVEDRELKILNEDGLEEAPGKSGNVWIRIDNGADFYLGDEVSTNAFFQDGWFKTGDLGLLRDDGRLEILGRANDVLIIRGDKQPSGLIERQIAEALGRNVCVFSDYRSDAVGDLIVVLEGSAPASPSETAQVGEVVAKLGVPYRVTTHDVFPRNGMGKVKRSDLISEAHLF